MKFWERIFGKPLEHKRAISYQQGLEAGLCGVPVRSGVTVTESTALTLSTVWRAARLISESVGTLPLKLYRKGDDGRTEATDHFLWTTLHDEPNPEMGTVDFLSLLQWWACLWGNAYAEVERDGTGAVLALWPVAPWRVKTCRDSDGLYYEVDGDDEIRARDMLHIKGPSPDGSEGYRLVHQARESFGFSLACDQFGSSFFGNAARPSGVLEVPNSMSPETQTNIAKSWNQLQSGVSSTGKVAVLEEGVSWKPLSVSNEAGQYDQTRQFQVLEVCRWLGVDPIFVYAFGANPGGVAEQQTRNFLTFTLNPWLRRWECELARKCISRDERAVLYPEFVREAILSLDAKTQAEIWGIGVDHGWLLADEVRKFQNMRPMPQLTPAPAPVQEDNGNEIVPQQDS